MYNKINIEEYCLLINSLPNEAKIKTRKSEETIKKRINADCLIKFGRTSLKENILSVYSYYYYNDNKN